VALAHRLAVLEPAGADDHALQRADAAGLAVARGHHAAHAAVLADQLRDRRLQPQRDLEFQQRMAQAADQRVAHREATRTPGAQPPREIAEIAQRQSRDDLEPAGRLAEQHRALEVGVAHQPHHRRLHVRGLHAQELLAEQATVVGQRIDRSPPRLRAGELLVVIRVVQHRLVAHVRLLLEEAQHRGALFDEGAHDLGRDVIPGEREQVLHRLLDAVLHAGRAHQVVVGYPQPAAGGGRGAAVVLALLQDQHARAVDGGDQRRRQRAGARADDDDIRAVIPVVVAHGLRRFRSV